MSDNHGSVIGEQSLINQKLLPRLIFLKAIFKHVRPPLVGPEGITALSDVVVFIFVFN